MEHVNLKSLIFNSYDDHAELVVEARKESLSYSTTYLIDVLEINRIINLLQKVNYGQDLNDCVQSIDYPDFQEYFLDTDKIENCSLSKDMIDFMVMNSLKKQIRA